MNGFQNFNSNGEEGEGGGWLRARLENGNLVLTSALGVGSQRLIGFTLNPLQHKKQARRQMSADKSLRGKFVDRSIFISVHRPKGYRYQIRDRHHFSPLASSRASFLLLLSLPAEEKA